MSLYNELILERDLALKNGDFVEYSKLCLILATITVDACENMLNNEKTS